MTTTAPSDAELLAQARQGDESAFTELYVRHQGAARRLATAYPRAGDPDDLVNGAFERVLGALRRGTGPDEAFRAYLFVTLRRLAADQITRRHDDPFEEVPEPVRALEHTAPLDVGERQMVVEAYESLPERWQAVLWQTAVEGRQPRELAGVLGMSANAAAALAYRAREKLRQAYLQAHLQSAPRPQCEPHRSRLGAYVRDGLSQRDRGAAEGHLDQCGACRSLVAELIDVNSLFTHSLVPVFQATASQAGVAALAGGALAGGGVMVLGRQVVSKLRSNPTIVAGVVVVAALALALIALRGDDEVALPVEPPDPAAPALVTPQPPQSDEPPPPEAPPPTRPSPRVTTTTVETFPPPVEPVVPAPSPTPPPPAGVTTTTTTLAPSPPPTRPPAVGPVVWVPGSSELRITLENPTSEESYPTYINVDLDGGARVSGLPSNCAVSLVVIWTAKCAVLPLDPGETRVVEVPVRISDDGQTAYTTICPSGYLALDCILSPPATIETPMPPG